MGGKGTQVAVQQEKAIVAGFVRLQESFDFGCNKLRSDVSLAEVVGAGVRSFEEIELALGRLFGVKRSLE